MSKIYSWTSRNVLIFIFLFSISPMGLAQSTESEIKQMKDDPNKVVAYLKLGDTKIYDQPDSAAFYYKEAEALAIKINDQKGLADFISYYIFYLNRKGKYKEALELSFKGIKIGKKLADRGILANSYNNVGNQYSYLGDLELAARYYLKAIKVAEEMKDISRQQKFTNNLASVFLELRDKKKSSFYTKKSYELALKTKIPTAIASSLVNLGNSEAINERNESAITYYNKLIEIAKDFEDITYLLDGYINLGEIEIKRKKYKEALAHFKTAESILGKEENPDYQLYISLGQAQTFNFLNQPLQAKQHVARAISIAKDIEASHELRQLYKLGAEIEEKLKLPFEALNYRKHFEVLNDSLMNAETQKNIHALEIEYQTAQKEKAITQQKLIIAQNKIQLQEKNVWILFAGLAIFLLLLTVIFVYWIYKNKQRSHAERLSLLDKQRQLEVLEAMMAGEEKERSRLAKDLHDGIGGILSATKMHLSILKNDQLTSNLNDKFDNTLGMLDNASKEVRSIAHNLAPEILMKQGLDKALLAFCERVTNSNLVIDYYCVGDIPRLKNNFELVVYRIVQELINNIIKHSHASHAIVQISFYEGLMNLTIEDNGIGMQKEKSTGIGMINLESRVKAVNGTLSIRSEIGDGTTVDLEFDTAQFQLNTIQEKQELIKA